MLFPLCSSIMISPQENDASKILQMYHEIVARFYLYCFRKRTPPKKFVEFYCDLPPDIFCHNWYLFDHIPLLEKLLL